MLDDTSQVIPKNMHSDHIDPEIFELIPHRPPMLLIHRIDNVEANRSSAWVYINESSSFFESEKGVPSWIALEYMGQTAALIAGYQLREGLIGPHLGFLLGTRSFEATCEYFPLGAKLLVTCEEKALLGNEMATFDCKIYNQSLDGECLAKATLSVYRKAQ